MVRDEPLCAGYFHVRYSAQQLLKILYVLSTILTNSILRLETLNTLKSYSSYEDFDFIVPVGTAGDTYRPFHGSPEEIAQSLSIIRQALDNMPEGKYYAEDVLNFYLPPKEEVYRNMEALIWHFKIVMGEIEVPAGEVYHAVEGGNGELGFLPGKRRRTFTIPSALPAGHAFIYYQAFPEMVRGAMLSDAIPYHEQHERNRPVSWTHKQFLN